MHQVTLALLLRRRRIRQLDKLHAVATANCNDVSAARSVHHRQTSCFAEAGAKHGVKYAGDGGRRDVEYDNLPRCGLTAVHYDARLRRRPRDQCRLRRRHPGGRQRGEARSVWGIGGAQCSLVLHAVHGVHMQHPRTGDGNERWVSLALHRGSGNRIRVMWRGGDGYCCDYLGGEVSTVMFIRMGGSERDGAVGCNGEQRGEPPPARGKKRRRKEREAHHGSTAGMSWHVLHRPLHPWAAADTAAAAADADNTDASVVAPETYVAAVGRDCDGVCPSSGARVGVHLDHFGRAGGIPHARGAVLGHGGEGVAAADARNGNVGYVQRMRLHQCPRSARSDFY
mmetsp:Transcript_34934/g.87459  ORF Transcript_34934/g.87459 Transcript_34934/m.87459 type:complete len:340 (+) Transcript_34934:375-1394(+)